MKLAEALLEKKNLLVRIEELQGRYVAAAVIEEGQTPDEAAADLLMSLSAALDDLKKLTVSINRTNNVTMVETGVFGSITMMEAIALRDSLKTKIHHYNTITSALRQRNHQRRFYGENGPKLVVAEGVDVKYFIALVDGLSKDLRLLDAAIQAGNWANELQ